MAREEELVTQTARIAKTSLLALFLAGGLVGQGAALTPPASIAIAGLPERVVAGEPVSFTVTVRGEAGEPIPDYAGTVRFTSSSASAELPDDYTFGPEDAGAHEFTFVAAQAGPLTLAVSAGPDLRAWRRTRVAPAAGVAAASVPTASVAGSTRGAPRNAAVPSARLYIVAHQDDDLLFMNPDVEDDIRAGRRVRTIFLTAAASPDAWQGREDAVLNAYPAMANVARDWTCAPRTYLTSKVVRMCTLNPQPSLSVVFVRLPDGNGQTGGATLPALWSGPPFNTSVPSLSSFTRPDDVPPTPSSTYNRAELLGLLTALIAEFAPDLIGIQDSTLSYGDDHADHIATALFSLEAEHTYTRSHQLWMYRGYNVSLAWGPPPAPEEKNLSPAQHDEKLRIMEIYNGGPLPPDSIWQPFCWRRYTLSRLFGGRGPLANADGLCIDAGVNPTRGTPGVAVACSEAATRWTVSSTGLIQSVGAGGAFSAVPLSGGGRTAPAVAEPKPRRLPRFMPPVAVARCLGIDTDGTSVVLGACTGGPGQTWTLTTNGQIRGRDGSCLTVAGDGATLQASVCEPDMSAAKWLPRAAQRWVQRMGPVGTWSAEFSDAELGTPAAYAGSFRLGDLDGDGFADACARLAGGLFCSLNARNGSFAPHQLYSAAFSDMAGWLPPAYGSTLQLADVDGNGRADVCGRSSAGIVCATGNADATAMVDARRWSAGADFSDAQGWATSPSYYGSIRFADVNGDGFDDVCGRTSSGVVCALNDRAGHFAPATLWIADFLDAEGWQPDAYGTTLQLADLDGDGKADVCVRGKAGIRCATANAAGTAFVDAHQWSLRSDFTDADGWSAGAAYYGSIRLADVNGDGLADVCGRGANGVVCAISNGAGFDGALAVQPDGYTDASGWSAAPYGATLQLGDLNHDGRRDVCGRGASGLVCAKAP